MVQIADEHPQLYHYTGSQGLMGILESQSLWATNYKFLNDSKEIIYCREKLTEWILPAVIMSYKKLHDMKPHYPAEIEKRGGIEACASRDAERFVLSKYRAFGDEIYITSFCGISNSGFVNDSGLLSQWRGYGRDGGYALVFDTKELCHLLDYEAQKFAFTGLHLSTVAYSDDKNVLDTEFAESIGHLKAYFTETFESVINGKNESADATEAYPSFLSCISRYKHWGFKEENEVRIVASRVEPNERYQKRAEAESIVRPEKIKEFISKNGTLIPYINLLSELMKQDSNFRLPIKKIIVGPHREKQLRKESLSYLLKQKSMENVEVIVSDIPFIS